MDYLDNQNLLLDKFAIFKGSKLFSQGHTDKKFCKWYEHNWITMDCSFYLDYCFKIQFHKGRIVNTLDLDGNEDREFIAHNIEDAIAAYETINKNFEILKQKPLMELLVVLVSNNKVYARKLLQP